MLLGALKEDWSGAVSEIEQDFVRFIDAYMHKLFAPNSNLDSKKILGAPLSASSFGEVVRNFAAAFQDIEFHAQTFTQAVQTATVLTTRDQLAGFLLQRDGSDPPNQPHWHGS